MSTQSFSNDQHRSHIPYSFVVIGDELSLIRDYDMTKTSRGEASSLNVTIPLDNIDSKIFVNFTSDDYVPIEVYTGYMLDVEDFETQFQKISESIGYKQVDKKFVKRFDGFVSQPEWTFGDERMLTLNCFDWSQILREYQWDRNLKDGETEVKKVIELMQQKLSGLKIIADPYIGSLKLGDKDQDTKKWSYNASGKKYFEILEDCAQKMGKNVIVDGKNIYITKYKEQPLIWNFFYGERDSSTFKASDNLIPFKSVKLRIGQVGETQKSNVVVDLYSRTVSKKGKASATHVRYPENAQINALTKHITRTLKNNLSDSELRVYAEQIWKHESTKIMTGNVDVDFANPFIDIYDIVTFKTSDSQMDLKYVEGYWFSINSISERYSPDGYTQTLDVDSNAELKQTLREKVVPKTKPYIQDMLGYTPVIGSNSVNILNRRLGQ